MNAYYVEHVRVVPESDVRSRGTYRHQTMAVWKIWSTTAASAMDRAREASGLKHTFEYLRCSRQPPDADVGVIELPGVLWT